MPNLDIATHPNGIGLSVVKVEIDGDRATSALGWVMTTPFNLMGQCPTVSAPFDCASSDAQTGMLIVVPDYKEAILLKAEMTFEMYGEIGSRTATYNRKWDSKSNFPSMIEAARSLSLNLPNLNDGDQLALNAATLQLINM